MTLKVVPGWDEVAVSSFGEVAWLRRGKWVPATVYTDEYGYLRLDIWRQNQRTKLRVHQLVMLAFVGPPPAGQLVRHLDGNSKNNYLDNLCYGTHAQNTADAMAHGTFPLGEDRVQAKLTNAQAQEIRDRYVLGGITQSKLAAEYNVTQMVVSRIVRGKTYA